MRLLGTAVVVWGTNIVPSPNIECFVDDLSIGGAGPFEPDANNISFCDKKGLRDGQHQLRVDVRIQGPNQSFYLDRIRYAPSADVPLEDKIIKLEINDPAIQLDAHWTNVEGSPMMTRQTNSAARVDFVGVWPLLIIWISQCSYTQPGTSLSWVALIPRDLPHNEAMGTWSIDGGQENRFLLKGLFPDQNETQYHTFYFTTPEVEAGPHTLAVTFLGSNETTPLCLDYLYVKNGTQKAPIIIKPDEPNTGAAHGESHVGDILGGVLGGLAFLILVAAVFLFWSRQRNRHHQANSAHPSVRHFDIYNQPQPLLPTEVPRDSAVGVVQMSRMRQVHTFPGKRRTTARAPVGVESSSLSSQPTNPQLVDTPNIAPPQYMDINPLRN